MSDMYDRLLRCKEQIRQKTDIVPQMALVLGSGLGGFAEEIDVECRVPYGEIEGFPVSTVAGHKGQFIFGRLGDVKIVCMQGRVHCYEGYTAQEAVMPIRLMKMLGAERIMLTNAAGGINAGFRAGDLMLLTDHISLFAPNPLIGENIEQLGVRFPDMSSVYNKKLQSIIKNAAAKNGIDIKEGVYVQLTGPSYETPAEIKMLGKLGADAVGMSTVCEAIAANHAGMQVCAVSCISNMAAGIAKQPLTHAEVQQTADAVAKTFETLVKTAIADMF